MGKLNPIVERDFRQGRYSPNRVSGFIAPENSVAHAINVNFDEILGSAKVRPGTTKLGLTVASGEAALGFGAFMGVNGSPNLLLAIYKGASTATVYYFDTAWHTSALTTLSNAAKTRLAVLGGRVFLTNTADGMKSSADGNTWTTDDCAATTIKPSVLFRYTARLLAAGDPTNPGRIYFSSIIIPNTTPYLTWNLDASSGDWIDVNPDDGGYITGFSESSTYCLIFKNTGMYRLNVVDTSVDPENIFNVGAVSQEAIVLCQGITYFFSGIDIRRTNGDFPEQISRAGVQDVIDAIPQTNWSKVAGATDGLNVYFSVGTVVLRSGQSDQETITNCVLKYSPRDQNWSVHSYADVFSFMAPFTYTDGQLLRATADDGDVHTINVGTTDNGTDIAYYLESQDLEFGSRAHWKTISDKVIVYAKNGTGGYAAFKSNGTAYVDVTLSLANRVNIGQTVNVAGNFINFVWHGATNLISPILEGYEIEEITDIGVNNG